MHGTMHGTEVKYLDLCQEEQTELLLRYWKQ